MLEIIQGHIFQKYFIAIILLFKMIQNPIFFTIQLEPLNSLFRNYFINITNQAVLVSKK